MLEAEAEYVQQLHILVNNFLRPLRMAASSKKPPITHDDVSSIFLNRWLVVRPVVTAVVRACRHMRHEGTKANVCHNFFTSSVRPSCSFIRSSTRD